LSDERRYGPRRLASLFSDDVELSDEQGNVWIQGLTADSGAVEQGWLFAALPGTKADGATFVAEATAAGAAAILIGDQKLEGEVSVPASRAPSPP
jgi:UDP-N-acetylmuramoyl-L-alanyl-D-glutamate--2,6-diaminopimelate ligase